MDVGTLDGEGNTNARERYQPRAGLSSGASCQPPKALPIYRVLPKKSRRCPKTTCPQCGATPDRLQRCGARQRGIVEQQPPVGDAYFQVEGGNGELGFYVISDGTKNPYRVRCRPPCFAIYQAFGRMITGQTIPDVVAALGSLNIIAGELDH